MIDFKRRAYMGFLLIRWTRKSSQITMGFPMDFSSIRKKLVDGACANLEQFESQKDPLDFAAEIMADANRYKGFNLILTDICTKKMVHVTNRPKEDSDTIMEVSQGVHVLTNSSLDCSWPKAQRLSRAFKEVFGGDSVESTVDLRQMVEKLTTDTVKAEESEIPNILAKDFEIQTSSIFTDADTELGRYGTRSMSAVAVKGNGEVSFYERHLDENSWKENVETYKIDQHISREL